jgi:hypothetical protein
MLRRSNFIARIWHKVLSSSLLLWGVQASFPALSSSPHNTISVGFILSACYGQWMNSTSDCNESVSWTTRIVNGCMVLLEMDYTIGIKHSYRGHRYVLQNVLILKAAQMTYDRAFQLLHRSSAPIVNRHTTTAFAGRHAESFDAFHKICKRKRCHHLLS